MLEFSNLVFSFLFAVEMLLKIVSDGPFGYIRDGFNVFDGFIVVLRSVAVSVVLDYLSCLQLAAVTTAEVLFLLPCVLSFVNVLARVQENAKTVIMRLSV